MTSLLLRGGRVIDPRNEVNEVADLLVRDGKVAAVGTVNAPEAPMLDVKGLVVGPGYVDLHSHVHSVAGQRLQALDGVSTALDLEAGLYPVGKAYDDAAAQGRPLHYGFAASWSGARAKVLAGIHQRAEMAMVLHCLGEPEWQRSSSSQELATWLGLLEDELAA